MSDIVKALQQWRNKIVEALQQWRNKDQADTILLHRNEVIALLTEIENARAMCDSYAKENQQFHDEIERLQADNAKLLRILNKAGNFVLCNGDGAEDQTLLDEIRDATLYCR